MKFPRACKYGLWIPHSFNFQRRQAVILTQSIDRLDVESLLMYWALPGLSENLWTPHVAILQVRRHKPSWTWILESILERYAKKLHITTTDSANARSFSAGSFCLRNGFRQSCLWDSWEVCFEGTFHRLWQSNANRVRYFSYDSLFAVISHTIITIKHQCRIFKSLSVADGGSTQILDRAQGMQFTRHPLAHKTPHWRRFWIESRQHPKAVEIQDESSYIIRSSSAMLDVGGARLWESCVGVLVALPINVEIKKSRKPSFPSLTWVRRCITSSRWFECTVFNKMNQMSRQESDQNMPKHVLAKWWPTYVLSHHIWQTACWVFQTWCGCLRSRNVPREVHRLGLEATYQWFLVDSATRPGALGHARAEKLHETPGHQSTPALPQWNYKSPNTLQTGTWRHPQLRHVFWADQKGATYKRWAKMKRGQESLTSMLHRLSIL